MRDGYYDGTVFHRVIPNFVVQGGGFDDRPGANASRARRSRTRAATACRTAAARSASRATTARTPARSQFYINLADNAGLDPLPSRWGYAVFGQVVDGMDVVDRIGYLRTETVPAFGADVPVERRGLSVRR